MDEHQRDVAAVVRLDLRGLKCPLPALKTRSALARLAPSAILVVDATDAMAAIDIPHLVSGTGDEMVEQSIDGDVLTFRIRKAPPARREGFVTRGDRPDGEA